MAMISGLIDSFKSNLVFLLTKNLVNVDFFKLQFILVLINSQLLIDLWMIERGQIVEITKLNVEEEKSNIVWIFTEVYWEYQCNLTFSGKILCSVYWSTYSPSIYFFEVVILENWSDFFHGNSVFLAILWLETKWELFLPL